MEGEIIAIVSDCGIITAIYNSAEVWVSLELLKVLSLQIWFCHKAKNTPLQDKKWLL